MPKSTNYKTRGVEWKKATDIDKRLKSIISKLDMSWINENQVYSFRSKKSKARAYARIWGLPRIWQIALKEKPSYIVEVLSEKYDDLPQRKKDQVLLHELSHIPKNFSGSLVPHFKKGKRKFSKKVGDLIKRYERIS